MAKERLMTWRAVDHTWKATGWDHTTCCLLNLICGFGIVCMTVAVMVFLTVPEYI